jgi:hypothetical protein
VQAGRVRLHRCVIELLCLCYYVVTLRERIGAVPAPRGAHDTQPGQHRGVQAGRRRLHRCFI